MTAQLLIAIVDDDVGVRTAVSNLVRSEGYAVRLFECAEDFLADRCEPAPDCLITDVQMSGLSGLDLLQIVRARPNPIPVLVMTGRPDQDVRDRALASGALCLLGKPFDASELFDHLGHALASGRS